MKAVNCHDSHYNKLVITIRSITFLLQQWSFILLISSTWKSPSCRILRYFQDQSFLPDILPKSAVPRQLLRWCLVEIYISKFLYLSQNNQYLITSAVMAVSLGVDRGACFIDDRLQWEETIDELWMTKLHIPWHWLFALPTVICQFVTLSQSICKTPQAVLSCYRYDWSSW